MAKTGFTFRFPHNIYIDTFLEYSYCKMDFKKHSDGDLIHYNVNVGGISLGLGLGYEF